MDRVARAVNDLRSAYGLIQGIPPTGMAGVEANIERTAIYISLALLALGQEDVVPAGPRPEANPPAADLQVDK